MKKLIALLLVLTLALGLVACGTNADNGDETSGSTGETTESTGDAAGTAAQGSALEILETVWAAFGEDEKFPVMGGDYGNIVDGAPGAYSLEDTESLTAQLIVPADQAANISEAAALFHGMMVNNFTAGAFVMAEGADANAFADTMNTAITGHQFLCGAPENLSITIVGENCVVVAFGLADVLNSFETKLTTAYADANVLYTGSIAG